MPCHVDTSPAPDFLEAMIDLAVCSGMATLRLPSSCSPWRSALLPPIQTVSAEVFRNSSFAPQRAAPASGFRKEAHCRVLAMAAAPTNARSERPFGVLFVCLGNICRSPTAEAVFRYIVEKKGLGAQFKIDSAGTIDYHEGDPADARMKAAAQKRGIDLTSISRPIKPSDFDEFDLIVAMDKKNRADILKAYTLWNKNEPYSFDGKEKVKLMCSYCKKYKDTEVPDPYYGGPAGFEKVLDLLEDACEGLLENIISSN